MKGWVYILKCGDDTYYTGSTNNILLRIQQHAAGIGANYTAKRPPVEIVYLEEFKHVSEAFCREKQIQGWSRRKKEALMKNDLESLKLFSSCYKDFHDALKGLNGRFKKQNLDEIKGIDQFLLDEGVTSELLDFINNRKLKGD